MSTKAKVVTNASVIDACRVAGHATEKVAHVLRARLEGLDTEQRAAAYASLCADAMIVDGVKHTKAEMQALPDRRFMRGYNALVSAWRELNKAPSAGPRGTQSLAESLHKVLAGAVERIQKAKPERVTFDAAREIAALQAAMTILKK